MKAFMLSTLFLAASAFGIGTTPGPVGDYRMHLFFGDSAPFVDDLRIERNPLGSPTGTMHVPNDFDGVLENIVEAGDELEFDLFVPKNASRPVDLVFHYRAVVLYPGADHLSGFVTLAKSDGKPVTGAPYIGSFVAFRKPQ